ncbi:apolipoprotein N-acyltransferase [Aestuariispira insulae]|uniref:Apolipoprotein N-acyltransferase n=2 Tax=Aestuariispira insulae TaxID=1461337 RepID=A0A3D9HQB5_9PROT|nr:apolipoprotein N-acyltransferase [Aestuariispira insulae]
MRIVQPAIPQKEKWGSRYRARNFADFLQLTQAGRGNGIHTVIWPETAAAFFLEDIPEARQAIARALPEGGVLITGAPRRDTAAGTIHNSGLVLDADGEVIEAYDKSHLVPFGEYVPLRSVLPVEKVAHGMSDYTPGPGPRTIHIPGVPPVSILICYEAVFPGQVVNDVQRPKWMLNLTNDAWYGRTAGPYQHLAIVRTRAVEEGLPMVRAASTGISAVYDSYGREMGRLALEQAGYLDFALPEPLEEGTVFSRTGNGLMILLVAAILGMLVVANNRLDSKQL